MLTNASIVVTIFSRAFAGRNILSASFDTEDHTGANDYGEWWNSIILRTILNEVT